MGLIDHAAIVTRAQFLLRQGRGRAGAGDQDGVGLGADQLQDLAGHAGVGAAVFFDRDDLDALGLGGLLHHVQPAVAVGVGEADEAQRLDLGLGHGVGQRAGHQGVVLRSLEDPAALVVDRLDDLGAGGHADHRHLGFGGHVDHGQRAGVTDVPISTSTLSSEASLREFLTACVVSVASSRTIHSIFWPATSFGSRATVLRSGMPSEAAGRCWTPSRRP